MEYENQIRSESLASRTREKALARMVWCGRGLIGTVGPSSSFLLHEIFQSPMEKSLLTISPKAQDIMSVSKVMVKRDKGFQTEIPANLCRTGVSGRQDSVDPLLNRLSISKIK